MDYNKEFDTFLIRRDEKDPTKVNVYYPITHSDNIEVDTYDGMPQGVKTLTDLLKQLNDFAYTGITITKDNIGLGNVTNDRQIKGIAQTVGENHVVVFGSDGYTVKDGGHTVEADVPADAVFTDTTYDDASETTKGVVQLSNSLQDGSKDLVPTTEVTYQLYALLKKAVKTIESGNANGTICVDGKDVSVAGLRSAAFMKSGEFATNRQGKLADNAVQRSGDNVVGPITTDRKEFTEDNEFISKAYVDGLISSISGTSAIIYTGTIGSTTDNAEFEKLPVKALVPGLAFKVITDGTYAGYSCTKGDLLVCKATGKSEADTTSWSLLKGNDQTLTTVEIGDDAVNITTTAQSGRIVLGSAASKKSTNVLNDYGTEEELPTAKAVVEYIKGKKFLQEGVVVNGIKGSNETSYRTGEVSISAADVGAATQEQGQKADTAVQDIKIGTVKTGNPGTTASALARKDSDNNVSLDLVIPQGPKGESGITPNIQAGTVTTVDSDKPAEIVITGTKDAPILNFSIPRGLTGKGADGDAGSIDDVQAQLLPAGALPTVLNTGTAQHAILTFGIPKGDKGDPGEKGDPGDIGPAGNLWYIGFELNIDDDNRESQESFIYPESNVVEARIGDCYFNIIHDDIYQCTLPGDPNTAKWKYMGTTKGKQGEPGLSTYDIAVKNGFVGNESDFIKGITNPKNVDVANYIFKICKSFRDYEYHQRLHPLKLTKALISFIDDDGSIIPSESKSGLLKFMNDRGIPLGVALSKENFDNEMEKSYYSIKQLRLLLADENELIMTGHKDSDYTTMTKDEISAEMTEIKDLFALYNFDGYSFAYPGEGIQIDDPDFADKINTVFNNCSFAFTGVNKAENGTVPGYEGMHNDKTLGYWMEAPFSPVNGNCKNNLIIPRMEISAEHHLQSYDVNEIIDRAIQNKGYICFHFSSRKGTFLNNGAELNGSDRVKEIIQYIIDNYGTTVDFVSPTFAGERIMSITTAIDEYHDILNEETLKKISDMVINSHIYAQDVAYIKKMINADNVQDAIDFTNQKIDDYRTGIDRDTIKELTTSPNGKLLFKGKSIDTDLPASNINYDNSNSHMKSTNVQDAIDSLKNGIDDINAKKHEHANKDVIDKFSESSKGTLLYDGNELSGKAKDISYDNTTSKIAGTNVQDAIDEVVNFTNGIFVTISTSGWTAQSSGLYTYTATVRGISGSEVLDADLYDDGSATDEQVRYFDEEIKAITTGSNSLTITSYSAPTESFIIVLRGKMEAVDYVENLKKIDAVDTKYATEVSNIKTSINNTNTELSEVRAIISDVYDNTKTYVVGDYCIYDNQLYKCIAAITTPEDFDVTKWSKTTVDDEMILFRKKDEDASSKISSLKSTVTTLSNTLDALSSRLMPIGYIFEWSPVSGSSMDLSTAQKVHDYFGFGTWQLITDRVIIGAGGSYSVNSLGGEATHKLTENEIPSHSHSFSNGGSAITVGSTTHHSNMGTLDLGFASGQDLWFSNMKKNVGSISYSGGSSAHNNLPPYKAAYIWQRIA